jgi:Tol biopolymer transport system component
VFQSRRRGPSNLYVKAVSGADGEELLLERPNDDFPQDWSKDGRFLLYWEVDSKTGKDLWALPMTVGNAKPADAKPILIANTPFEERNGQFSPDGKWVAYETNESGRFEIVVQPFPERSGKWQVSSNGGVQPRWRADGKELYFIAPDGKMMAATISSSASGFSSETPVELFSTHLAGPGAVLKQQYAIWRDGRFLLNQQTDTANAPITLILNWKPPK